MNVLELFAGSRSVGKAANELGMRVYSSDITQFGGIDYVVDILDFDVKEVMMIPDVIWASPPCTSYSIAAVSHHRNAQEPKTEFAKKTLGVCYARWTSSVDTRYDTQLPTASMVTLV